TGINQTGQVVGYSELPAGAYHGFIFQKGNMLDLGTLAEQAQPGSNSVATAINASNDVVGFSYASTGEQHAVIWIKGDPSRILDLNTSIDPGLGWTLFAANGINDRGQIVGTGLLGGELHAFLLTPPIALASFTLKSSSVCGTAQTTGVVTLTGPAGADGVSVTILGAHPSIADGPPTVTVPAGETTATFPITTHQVTDNVDVTFQVLLNGQTQSATLTVKPLLSGINFAPKEICSRTDTVATV